MDGSSCHSLDTDNTLILGFMGQHGSSYNISDGIDTKKRLETQIKTCLSQEMQDNSFEISIPGHFSLETAIDRDSPAVIQFNTDGLETEVTGEGTAANAHQQNVTGESLVLAPSCSFHTNQRKQYNGQKH